MFRYSNIDAVDLSLIILILVLSGCVGQSVSITRSPTVTERPLSPTLVLESVVSKIDKTLNLLTKREAFTGAVLVAQNGEVLFNQGYGLADRDKDLSNTSQTKYRIGSITKQFTAAAILMLQAQGKLTVHDPVCGYISECPEIWQDITIHHLLTHTSGIPDFTSFPDYEITIGMPSSPLRTLARFKDRSLDFKPGEKWSYSDSNYIVLGYIIEIVSGESYETFLQKNIFEPVQMKNTGYDHNDGNLATGYTGFYDHWEKAGYVDMTVPYASGGLYSTIEDLYRWDQVLYSEQLVSQELLRLMFTPQTKIPTTGLSYSYGWVVGEMNNHRAVSHGGGLERFGTAIRGYTSNSGNGFKDNGDLVGFAAEITRYIDDKVTIIILSNRDTTNVGTISDQIARIIFGDQ